MQTMTIDISPNGDTKIAVKGAPGKSCKTLTEGIEKDLGTVKSDVPTAEMRQEESRVIERTVER